MEVETRPLEKIFRIEYVMLLGQSGVLEHDVHLATRTDDDFYEVIVAEVVSKGCLWIGVGYGRDVFMNSLD